MVNSIKHVIVNWWKATRYFAFPATITPVMLGALTSWAIHHNEFLWDRFLLSMVGVLLMHSGANMLNDFFDYRKGIDRPGTYGSSGLLIEKVVSPHFILISGIVSYLLVIPIALYLWFLAGPSVVIIGMIGLILGIFYTTGVSFKYLALGDIAVFTAFGMLVTLGSYYVQTGELSWIPVLYSIPLGLLIDGILHGNNLRDISADAVVNVRTLAGYLGVRGSQFFYLFLVAGAFISIPLLVFIDHLPWTAFLIVLSLPLAIRNVKTVFKFPNVPESRFRFIDAMGAQLQLVFGLLMIMGVFVGHWI